MLIDGERVASEGGKFIPVETPAKRGTVIAEVPRAMEADVDRAVKAAAKAFESWKRMAPRDRGKLMLKIAVDMEAQSEDIAKTFPLRRAMPSALNPGERSPLPQTCFASMAEWPVSKRVKRFLLVSNCCATVGANPSAWLQESSPGTLRSCSEPSKLRWLSPSGMRWYLSIFRGAPCGSKIARICNAHLPKGVLNVLTGSGNECERCSPGTRASGSCR